MIPTNYTNPPNGAYNETEATFADGREATINTQYSAIYIGGDHDVNCDQINKMGGRCTCPQNADIMTNREAIIVDARRNGKFGYPKKDTKKESDLVINPAYAHMTRDEIKAAERQYDIINNEGGEGYNPLRDNLYI